MEREFIMDLLFEGKSPEDEPLIKEALAANPGKGGDNTNAEEEKTKPPEKMKRPPPKDPDSVYVDPDMPKRYAHLQLDKHWYSVTHKAKRKHRKTEGSVGFTRLTWMVSSRWKRIGTDDPETKAYCQRLADRELARYKKATEEYREKVRLADEARKRESDAMAAQPTRGGDAQQHPTPRTAPAALGALLGMAAGAGPAGPDGAGSPFDRRAPPGPPARAPPPPQPAARRGSLLRAGPGTPTNATFRSSFRDSFARGSFRLGSDFGRLTDLSMMSKFQSPFADGAPGGLPGVIAGALPPPPFSGGSGGSGGGAGTVRPSEEALAMARAEMEAEARANFARSNSSHSQRSQKDMMAALAHAEARASGGGLAPGRFGFVGAAAPARGDPQPGKELDAEVTRFLNRFRQKGSQGSQGSGEGRSA